MNQNSINQGAMLPVGAVLRGIYRIESYLSSGGFGNTYVATNIEFDETVAIKEFFIKGVSQRDDNNTTVSVSNIDNLTLFDEQLQKFKKEARRLRKLHNEHIVRVHDLFEENGTAYYVMDYIDGENLGGKLKRLQAPLDDKEVMVYLTQVLDALESVHKQGIWHLDLKPANIMVDRNGVVSLIDFGASKQRSAKGGATSSTSVSYTNGFAPREQMEQNLEKFGPWTDIYALGATVYNLVTNRNPPLPSDIDDDRTDDKHLALPFPKGVSENVRRLVLKMMTTDRFDRPQSVEELKTLIGNLDRQQQLRLEEERRRKEMEERERKAKEDKERKERESSTKIMDKPKEEESNPTPSPSFIQRYMKALLTAFPIMAVGWLVFSLMGSKGDSNSEVADSAAYVASMRNAVEEAVKIVESKSDAETVKDLAYSNVLGKFTYTGEVNENKVPNGEGKAVFANGNVYEGPFNNGNMDGLHAVYKYSNGDVFEGSFSQNYFDRGRYTIASSGEYFEGSFKNGNPSKGTWYDKNGNVMEKI